MAASSYSVHSRVATAEGERPVPPGVRRVRAVPGVTQHRVAAGLNGDGVAAPGRRQRPPAKVRRILVNEEYAITTFGQLERTLRGFDFCRHRDPINLPILTRRRNRVVFSRMRCPCCSGFDCRGSRLRGTDRLLFLLLVRPRRCRECFHRFWRPVVWY